MKHHYKKLVTSLLLFFAMRVGAQGAHFEIQEANEKVLKAERAIVEAELAKRREERLPYVDSEKRQEHINKIRTLSLENLVENEKRMRLDRAIVCTKTVIKIPFAAVIQYIPIASKLAAKVSSDVEKTYHPDDSFDQATASYLGVADIIGGDVGVLLPNLGTRVNDPVKALFKAAFSHKDSRSDCARFTVNLADVRVEIASRNGKESEVNSKVIPTYDRAKIKPTIATQ